MKYVSIMWIILLFLILISLFFLIYPLWQRHTTIKKWYKSLDLNKHFIHYHQLFAGIDGFALSKQARATQNAMEYTYGEIDFISFIALLSLVKPNRHTVFYDLGSGTGKAVLACAMVFDVQKSCGIELFNTLHLSALDQKQRLRQQPDYAKKEETIQFINNDFLQTDFNDATLVFINATAFFGETWLAINKHLLQTTIGTVLITTSKKLILNGFTLIKTTTVQMSWGPVSAYIQVRN